MRRALTTLAASVSAVGMVLVGAAPGTAFGAEVPAATAALAGTVGTPLNAFTDQSGLVTVSVFTHRGTPARQHWNNETITIPDPDMIAIGGGGTATNQGAGALLTASYPNADLSGWVVSSKDHVNKAPHELVTYAIGLKVAGMTRAELAASVYVGSASNYGPHPEAEAGIPSASYVLVGGGFKIDWSGAGNLATASFPSSASSWKARSKDQGASSPATLHTYAIGLRRSLPVGAVSTVIAAAAGSQAAHPTATAVLPQGYVLTGGGADVHWNRAGNLLWKLEPTRTSTQYFIAASKDHGHSDPSTIDVYAVGIRLM
ncbi:hypothetical protein [Actinoplanes sp. ATCC 53533]|uniref:hypothetical protein n=1 Tax=Actinoplanes sp. ATCC 53533 TaxID=1288362 RepID=UPI000F7AC2CD|nr:hypothetical protein [Actinoplanes sp. ATCC 53533]